jgi:hypothetical protein
MLETCGAQRHIIRPAQIVDSISRVEPPQPRKRPSHSQFAKTKARSPWTTSRMMTGFAEEFLFRGYSQFTLAEGMRFWPAAIFLSLLFGAGHLQNAGEAWPGALAAAYIGFFFCFTLRRTGNIWFAVGLHAAWDYGETFVYGVPDSGIVAPGHLLNSSLHGPRWLTGGKVGPEASIACFVVISLMFLVFHFVYPAKGKTSLTS